MMRCRSCNRLLCSCSDMAFAGIHPGEQPARDRQPDLLRREVESVPVHAPSYETETGVMS